MNDIKIVYAHHHLWDLENKDTSYAWLMVKEGEASLETMVLLEKVIN